MDELKSREIGVKSFTRALLWFNDCHKSAAISDKRTHLGSTSAERLSLQFLFPSVTQWGRRHIYCCLICIPGWRGKFKFRITSDCWPEPISDLRFHLSSCFKAPYNKISHSLEQAHVSGISKIPAPERAIPASYAWGQKLKADSGEGISGLL